MAGTPAGEFRLPEHPRSARFVDFGDSAGTEPVYMGNCLPISCELTLQTQRGRFVDMVGIIAPAHAGANPTLAPTGDTPLYAMPPRECCDGDNTRIYTDCSPTFGTPKDLILILGFPSGWNHCEPECSQITLRYDSGTGTWRSREAAVFREGSMDFEITCSDRGFGPEFKIVGSGCGSFTAWIGNVCANDAVFMDFNSQPVTGTDCCKWPLVTQEISGTIIGACTFKKGARFADYVRPIGGDRMLPVYEYTRCCTNTTTAAPECCQRLPKTLIVEIACDCPTFDGQIFTAVAGDGGNAEIWYDEIVVAGHTLTCAISCSAHAANDTSVEPCTVTTTDVLCEPQNFDDCTVRTYLAGAVSLTLGCDGTTIHGGNNACEQCDCNGTGGNPINMTITGTVECSGSSGCDCCTFVGQQFNFTASITA